MRSSSNWRDNACGCCPSGSRGTRPREPCSWPTCTWASPRRSAREGCPCRPARRWRTCNGSPISCAHTERRASSSSATCCIRSTPNARPRSRRCTRGARRIRRCAACWCAATTTRMPAIRRRHWTSRSSTSPGPSMARPACRLPPSATGGRRHRAGGPLASGDHAARPRARPPAARVLLPGRAAAGAAGLRRVHGHEPAGASGGVGLLSRRRRARVAGRAHRVIRSSVILRAVAGSTRRGDVYPGVAPATARRMTAIYPGGRASVGRR